MLGWIGGLIRSHSLLQCCLQLSIRSIISRLIMVHVMCIFLGDCFGFTSPPQLQLLVSLNPTQLSINVHIKATEMKGRFVEDGKEYRPVEE